MEPRCKVPRLVFPEGFTARDEWEMERKGFVYAFLECENGWRFQVMFIDPVRLVQDIEATLNSAKSLFRKSQYSLSPTSFRTSWKRGISNDSAPAASQRLTRRCT